MPADERQSTSCSILIADDDRDLCESLRDLLEFKGYQAEAVHTGRDALAACAKASPDVLLLDVNLPDFNGLDLIAEVEKSQPSIDILIITGHAALDNAALAVSRSTIGYLVKPLDHDRLFAFLRGIAERKRVAIENQELLGRIQQAKRRWECTFDAIHEDEDRPFDSRRPENGGRAGS